MGQESVSSQVNSRPAWIIILIPLMRNRISELNQRATVPSVVGAVNSSS